MFKLKESSYEFALKHIEKYGDTDIFPYPFEYDAIRFCWDNNIKSYFSKLDLSGWVFKPPRRCLTPKHKYGYRISTQLDPFDTIIFTALIFEIGPDLEKHRIPKDKNIVFSFRFDPQSNFRLFDLNYNLNTFRKHCIELTQKSKYKFVVLADIADFYQRLYWHPLENALKSFSQKNQHIKIIFNMLKRWNCNVSYGIPVGQSASRLLAEIAIGDVDIGLLMKGINYCRYIGDYRIFCKTEIQANRNLAFLANILLENHGLTLQQHKTKIVTIEEFSKLILNTEKELERDNLSNNFYKILYEIGIEDPYEELDYELLDHEIQNKVDNRNLIEILKDQITNTKEIDIKSVRFILKKLGQLNNAEEIDLIFNHIDKFYTVFKDVVLYINELKGLSISQKKNIGIKLIDLLDNSIVGQLKYHRAWVFNIFTKDREWNNEDKLMPLYNKYQDDFSKRKLILALGRAKQQYWFRSQKRNISQFNLWQKRAFLLAASCLPGDEAKHWYNSMKRTLDILETAIVKWAMENPFI